MRKGRAALAPTPHPNIRQKGTAEGRNGWVRGLVEDTARQRATEVADREETIAMYCEMATRHLCAEEAGASQQ